MEAAITPRTRTFGRNRLLAGLAIVHGFLFLRWRCMPFIAAGMWWNANTISHNFIHRPFFRRHEINQLFSIYLTLVLGFPQSLWHVRHLRHHGLQTSPEQSQGRSGRFDTGLIECVLLLAFWGALLYLEPRFALTVYLPGYLLGLALCGLHGYFEHARGTVSHYGRIYNLLLFNDGYHVEHHAHPGLDWRDLPACQFRGSRSSRYPPILRWLDSFNLRALEHLVLRHSVLQRFVIDRHERAIRSLLVEIPPVHRAGIVGGGLFPRTAIILNRLIPNAALTLIDMSAENLSIARPFVSAEVGEINKQFDPTEHCEFDLLVIPLSFVGDRSLVYKRPPARAILVHDWIWRPVGTSSVVSWLLLKRLNLVIR